YSSAPAFTLGCFNLAYFSHLPPVKSSQEAFDIERLDYHGAPHLERQLGLEASEIEPAFKFLPAAAHSRANLLGGKPQRLSGQRARNHQVEVAVILDFDSIQSFQQIAEHNSPGVACTMKDPRAGSAYGAALSFGRAGLHIRPTLFDHGEFGCGAGAGQSEFDS